MVRCFAACCRHNDESSGRREPDLVDARNLRAILATVGAVALTLPAIVITAFSSISLDKDDVILSPTPTAAQTLAEICTSPPAELRGALENRTPRRDYVVVTVAPGECREDEIVVRITKADIRAIVSR